MTAPQGLWISGVALRSALKGLPPCNAASVRLLHHVPGRQLLIIVVDDDRAFG